MRELKVGTDYSGMETPLIALQLLQVPHRHLFSSEICPRIRSVIAEKFAPERLFEDALARRAAELPKRLDLYVAGFPCQVFSVLNANTGNHRSPAQPLKHFHACVRAIETSKPKVFILENVPGLVTGGKGMHFASVRKRLDALQQYDVAYMILNARDYGSPQGRKRLYIVGIRGGIPARVALPPPVAVRRATFASLVQKTSARKRITATRQRVFDACARRFPHPIFLTTELAHRRCTAQKTPPCLLRKGGGIYSSAHRIVTTLREDMRLQGIPDDFHFPDDVSETAGRQMVGNAMSVDVLKHLFLQILKVWDS